MCIFTSIVFLVIMGGFLYETAWSQKLMEIETENTYQRMSGTEYEIL
jgi:hypothetical protein